jgi:hypothetical protein
MQRRCFRRISKVPQGVAAPIRRVLRKAISGGAPDGGILPMRFVVVVATDVLVAVASPATLDPIDIPTIDFGITPGRSERVTLRCHPSLSFIKQFAAVSFLLSRCCECADRVDRARCSRSILFITLIIGRISVGMLGIKVAIGVGLTRKLANEEPQRQVSAKLRCIATCPT